MLRKLPGNDGDRSNSTAVTVHSLDGADVRRVTLKRVLPVTLTSEPSLTGARVSTPAR